MRFYKGFSEALNELRRELKEMGIDVHTKSVQNLDITDNSDYDSKELQNYTYTVLNPDWKMIPLRNPEWAEKDFAERISGKYLNPGEAWKLRRQYWEQFLVQDELNGEKKFHYSYPERMADTVDDAIQLLKKDPQTRRAYIPIFNPTYDVVSRLTTRIPCSLGYWLHFRQDKLNITYLQRSSDFGEHFNYDIYMADRLKCHVAEQVGMQPGNFIHWLGSLHVFAKDVANVF